MFTHPGRLLQKRCVPAMCDELYFYGFWFLLFVGIIKSAVAIYLLRKSILTTDSWVRAADHWRNTYGLLLLENEKARAEAAAKEEEDDVAEVEEVAAIVVAVGERAKLLSSSNAPSDGRVLPMCFVPRRLCPRMVVRNRRGDRVTLTGYSEDGEYLLCSDGARMRIDNPSQQGLIEDFTVQDGDRPNEPVNWLAEFAPKVPSGYRLVRLLVGAEQFCVGWRLESRHALGLPGHTPVWHGVATISNNGDCSFLDIYSSYSARALQSLLWAYSHGDCPPSEEEV